MRICAISCVVIAACTGGRLSVRSNAALANNSAGGDLPPLPDGAPAGADPLATAAVGKDVAQKNAAEIREGSTFAAAGWTLIEVTDGPDARVMGFDPALIVQAPQMLRVQLLSTIGREADTDNVVAIVAAATTPDLRLAAISALGRIQGPRAQNAMLHLLTSEAMLTDADARHALAPLLRPRDLDDETAASMARLLDEPRLDDTDKSQLAFSLALIGVRDGMSLPASLSLSAAAAARIAAAAQLIEGVQ